MISINLKRKPIFVIIRDATQSCSRWTAGEPDDSCLFSFSPGGIHYLGKANYL
jgi:hypothetical protein